jgi:nitroreductase/NAD-dependent dihydropyrimidine dehydrogenase PreA subunit
MTLHFTVDETVCTGCGECAEDCTMRCIEMIADIPTMSKENEERCVQCQHCFAVCPVGALSILGKDPEQFPLHKKDLPSAEQVIAMVKGRRSIRQYKNEPVPDQQIATLLQTASYAPTAVNNHQVMFTVIDDVAVMDKLRQEVHTAIETKVQNGTMPPGMEFYLDLIGKAKTDGRDAIFRDAPHLLIASSPKESPSPVADCFIALSYFELLATSMGLGTLWCGLAKWALTIIAPELLNRFNIPENHEIVYMMLFGKPAVSYPRTVQREMVSVNVVKQL